MKPKDIAKRQIHRRVHKMRDTQRARCKIRALIRRAKRERDAGGYRENLGYDQRRKLQDYLNALDLTYSKRAALMGEFDRACDAI